MGAELQGQDAPAGPAGGACLPVGLVLILISGGGDIGLGNEQAEHGAIAPAQRLRGRTGNASLSLCLLKCRVWHMLHMSQKVDQAEANTALGGAHDCSTPGN